MAPRHGLNCRRETACLFGFLLSSQGIANFGDTVRILRQASMVLYRTLQQSPLLTWWHELFIASFRRTQRMLRAGTKRLAYAASRRPLHLVTPVSAIVQIWPFWLRRTLPGTPEQ
ncbi:MAG: hypothetical protein U5L02_06525 [Rheinheimera sp.]|nr:hypothetical protein [Rheinheimera sp.]